MDSDDWNTLAEKIAEIARSTPPELATALLPKLTAWDNANPALSRAKTLANVHNPQARADFGALLDRWQQSCPELPGSAIALALQSSLTLNEHHEQVQVDLAWTGPDTGIIPLRRSDGALLQVINSARHNLLIVSFAVYKVKAVVEALRSALNRGVQLKIILEQAEHEGGKLTFAASTAFGADIRQRTEMYVWPIDKRPQTEDGKYGALHAKIALADEKMLFISSANLTEYALNLNMEMGVLIRGGELPVQVARHFDELITQAYLAPEKG